MIEIGMASMAWLSGGIALGWTLQWAWHRRAVTDAVTRAIAEVGAATAAQAVAPAAVEAPKALAADVAQLRDEVARLAQALGERQEETRRLSNNVHLLDQQVNKLHLARSPVGLPRAVA